MFCCGNVELLVRKLTAVCFHSIKPILYLTGVTATSVVCEEEDGHISYHPDKADCTMYYMCEGERKHHMPCPSNLVFNPNENVCDWPENVEGCMHHTQAPPTAKRK
jgi:chitinase